VEEQALLQVNRMKEQIAAYYQTYSVTPTMVLARHQALFTTHTVAERMSGSYDSMAAWLRSVEEAMLVLRHQNEANRANSARFFPPPSAPHGVDTDTDTTYSATSLSSDTTLSLAPTDSTSTTQSTGSTNSVLVRSLNHDSLESSSFPQSLDDTISISSDSSSFSLSYSTIASDVECNSVASLSSGVGNTSDDEEEQEAASLDSYNSPTSSYPLYITPLNNTTQETNVTYSQPSLALSDESPVDIVVLPSGLMDISSSGSFSNSSWSSRGVESTSVASRDVMTIRTDVSATSGSADVEYSSVASRGTRSSGSLSSSDSLFCPAFAGQ
jgi:hypothetical protein